MGKDVVRYGDILGPSDMEGSGWMAGEIVIAEIVVGGRVEIARIIEGNRTIREAIRQVGETARIRAALDVPRAVEVMAGQGPMDIKFEREVGPDGDARSKLHAKSLPRVEECWWGPAQVQEIAVSVDANGIGAKGSVSNSYEGSFSVKGHSGLFGGNVRISASWKLGPSNGYRLRR